MEKTRSDSSSKGRGTGSRKGSVNSLDTSSSCPEPSFMEQHAVLSTGTGLESRSAPMVAVSTSSEVVATVVLGVCAMSKKCASKPMQAILSRIESYGYIKVLIFDDDTILNKPVTEWPHCNALISFFSKGFPLSKAIAYAELVKPFLINDLKAQELLQHRPTVYSLLEENSIETPRYKVLDRSSTDSAAVVEDSESIVIDGEMFIKPFVEKPVDAENHNVYIYYPPSAGGGSQRLFRKVHDRASVYSSETRVRDEGSYIYEDFMPTDGTDVKVYTVGPQYAHAEARKSPALDGKVERDAQGKEVRYPVILSAYEKEIARKVCVAFKQYVCGFDLLRAHGKSFVCDVNGFSFVKTSQKFYDDSAQILSEMIIMKCAPHLFRERIVHAVPAPLPQPSGEPSEELRCVIGIIRHGDRTPKQKMKIIVEHDKFYDLFMQNGGNRKLNIKLKKPEQLQKVLDVARDLLEALEASGEEDMADIVEEKCHLLQMKSVLEMHGHFSGINRKVQMRYRPHRRRHGTTGSFGSIRSSTQAIADSKVGQSNVVEPPSPVNGTLLLILKWGGELTPAGRFQARQLGKEFRCIYPGGQGEYGALPGCGLLRLHSTYRHDLKIYASDEGRVQTTAAAFAKGFLALEGELTPILVHLVKSYKTNSMLDKSDAASDLMCSVKERLHEILRRDCDFTDADIQELAPTMDVSLTKAIADIKNPTKLCERVHELVTGIVEQVQDMDTQLHGPELYSGESIGLVLRRWEKLQMDFKRKGKFDYSKIPDIFDCIKYDILHNHHLGLKNAEELFEAASHLANIVIPQEYGITAEEKAEIARLIGTPLVRKIRGDLRHQSGDFVHQLNPEYSRDITSPTRNVRTRLYFTSESHIHSVLNLLIHGQILAKGDDEWRRAMEYVSNIPEYSYMTQIVFLLYEASTKSVDDKDRFRVEVHLSPGASVQVVSESSESNSSNEPSAGGSTENLSTGDGLDSMDFQFSPPHSYTSWRPSTASGTPVFSTGAPDFSVSGRPSNVPPAHEDERDSEEANSTYSPAHVSSALDENLTPTNGDTRPRTNEAQSIPIALVRDEDNNATPTERAPRNNRSPTVSISTPGQRARSDAHRMRHTSVALPPLDPSLPQFDKARASQLSISASMSASDVSTGDLPSAGDDNPILDARVEPLRVLHRNISLQDFDAFLDRVLEASVLEEETPTTPNAHSVAVSDPIAAPAKQGRTM